MRAMRVFDNAFTNKVFARLVPIHTPDLGNDISEPATMSWRPIDSIRTYRSITGYTKYRLASVTSGIVNTTSF